MANERLYQFPSKASPVPADILFLGDSAAAFDERNSTIAQVVGAYPNLLAIGGLTIAANTFIFSNSSAVITTAPITALAISLLADATVSTMQGTLGYTATPTASLFAGWDANVNLSSNSFISAYATTVTAAATTTLLVGSKYQQFFTGTTTQTVLLPVTSTLVLGQSFYIANQSSGQVTVQSSGGNTIQIMDANTVLIVTCVLTSGTTAASWFGNYNQSAIALPVSLLNGGTNAALTASNGGLVYSSGTALAILAGTATANQIPLSGSNAAPSWSTLTYLATMAINTIPYASSANVMGVITPGASSVLVSSAGNVPSWSTVLPALTTADPLVAQGLATRNYVDQTALTGTSVYAASAASLGTVTQAGAGVGATLTNAGAQATFALDGVNPPVGVNVLIKNTATGMAAANEGIYTVTSVGSGATNWVLTRATNFDTAAEVNRTGLIIIQNGATLAGTAWYNTATIVTVDTTAFNFAQFGTSLTKAAITQIVTQIFTTGTSTYTPTPGMQFCSVELVGPGGGSGGAAGAGGQGAASAGGGGGGYCRKLYTAANIGASAAVIVSAGGAAGASGNNPGSAGLNTRFTPTGTGSLINGAPGQGGGGSASSATSTNSGNGGSGGAGTGGDVNITGGYGTLGVLILGTAQIQLPGVGGSTLLSTTSANISQGTAAVASNYGAGAPGVGSAGANVAGLPGADGICIVVEYVSV